LTNLILEIELVPSPLWYTNVRTLVSRSQWDVIRKRTYSRAYDLCQICGGVGPRHPVECHEIWSYNDTQNVQTLTGMIALCPACHQVKHFGFAQVRGKEDSALKHLMKINGFTKNQAEKYINKALLQWIGRSKKSWTVNLSHLSEYGIDVNNINFPSIA
jgi:hypothetical protein